MNKPESKINMLETSENKTLAPAQTSNNIEPEIFEKDGAWYKRRENGTVVRVRKTQNINPCGCG